MSKKYIPSEDIGEPLMSDWSGLEQLYVAEDLSGGIDLALRALTGSTTTATSWGGHWEGQLPIVIARNTEQTRAFAVLLQYDKSTLNVTYRLGSFPLEVGADPTNLLDWTIYMTNTLQLSADTRTAADQVYQSIECELEPYLQFE